MESFSINGDHINFRLYGAVRAAKSPMVVLSTPNVASQYDRVPNTNGSGKPDVTPNAKIISIFGVKYVDTLFMGT